MFTYLLSLSDVFVMLRSTIGLICVITTAAVLLLLSGSCSLSVLSTCAVLLTDSVSPAFSLIVTVCGPSFGSECFGLSGQQLMTFVSGSEQMIDDIFTKPVYSVFGGTVSVASTPVAVEGPRFWIASV